jgi:hypothetical protein
MTEELFIHSKCCNAHWELVYKGGEYSITCEVCGKGPGPCLKIEGPTLDEKCEICEQKKHDLH